MTKDSLPVCDGAAGEAPLVALLNRVSARFIESFDARLEATEFAGLGFAHSRDVLRHLGDGPLRASQIAGRCEVTKQAISLQIAQLERTGYIRATPDPTDGRARILTLTERGDRAQRTVVRLFGEIEAEWRDQVGPDAWEHLRAGLETLAEPPSVPSEWSGNESV